MALKYGPEYSCYWCLIKVTGKCRSAVKTVYKITLYVKLNILSICANFHCKFGDLQKCAARNRKCIKNPNSPPPAFIGPIQG